jgi:hypothetical protein
MISSKQFLTALSLMVITFVQPRAQDMNNQKLFHILKDVATDIDGASGAWSFAYANHMMLLITDETHNRMRIITPIDEVRNLSQLEYKNALMANFHTALDVKYAISDDLMWSVFIHPLQELSHEQVTDALKQVAQAADTFGGSYSSTDLVFPGAQDDGDEEAKPKKSDKKKM